ncbi:MAG: rhomboid family intramembrane serine protease [Saprospiraceae bacterium]
MINSLFEDLKGQFRYGNMVAKLILINVFVFVIFTFIGVFTPNGGLNGASFHSIKNLFALPGDLSTLLKRPWALFTHMFLHAGFGHIFWNMMILYWFGRIFGDLIGDKKVLPLYLVGGLAGAIFYLFFANFLSPYGGTAMGASAAVMAIVVASGFLAPNYRINLILIGEVKLMYIVAVLFFIDLAMIGKGNNTGGHFAHIGGALLGGFYISTLHRSGVDFIENFTSLFEKKEKMPPPRKTAKVITLHHVKRRVHKTEDFSTEETIDQILEKIKKLGVSSLTKEEKDVLDRASKE